MAESRFLLGFQGELPLGTVNTPIVPDGSGSSGDFDPYDLSWGVGLSLEYRVTPEISLFLDGNHYSYRKLVAEQGGYGTGFWVYEMTGYSSFLVGPFSDDAHFTMDSTGFRLGAKLGMPMGVLRPWIGAAVGFWYWSAGFFTADRTGTWGSGAEGYVWGYSLLGGLDWTLEMSPGNPVIVTLFADLMSPAVFPVITNLFQPGWTWDNAGGNSIMGPYRIGIGFAMPM